MVMSLSPDQQKALNVYVSGKSLLIIGPAGCGKSFVINKIQNYEDPKKVCVTAMSGVAAHNCGGITIHSFLGIGTGESSTDILARRILGNRCVTDRIRDTDVLVIDEFSMLSAELFEKIDKLCRLIRKQDQFMGGIQLVLCGDLLQLQPIFNKNEVLYGRQDVRLIFESQLFNQIYNKANGNIVNLTTNFRQNSKDFIDMLLRVRDSSHTKSDIDTLKSKIGDCGGCIQLVVSNRKAQIINTKKLDALNSESKNYIASFKESGDDKVTKELLKELKTQFELKGINEITLKVGARVMLIKNLDVPKGLVNGSVGTILNFESGCPRITFDNGIEQLIEKVEWELEFNDNKVIATQIPLMLAWSCTIHKIQGCTLDKAVMDLSDCFCDSQVYVALSRVKTLDGIHLKSFNERKITSSKKVLRYLNHLSLK